MSECGDTQLGCFGEHCPLSRLQTPALASNGPLRSFMLSAVKPLKRTSCLPVGRRCCPATVLTLVPVLALKLPKAPRSCSRKLACPLLFVCRQLTCIASSVFFVIWPQRGALSSYSTESCSTVLFIQFAFLHPSRHSVEASSSLHRSRASCHLFTLPPPS